jgi:RNA polymerase sigma factor (sigma-70 family)
MATQPMSTIIEQLRRATLLQAGISDGQLLDSFIARKDEAAFATLVRRHGPMVLGVCLRILRNHHDSEDAFQATFLVLARKASSINPRPRLAAWLHGVACRTALKARAMRAKRQVRERQVAQMPDPEAPQSEHWHDLQPLLDQELSRLPEIYRLPILLCDLEGKTIRETIQQLGWPQGTVAGRLARGRKLLAKRLMQRGAILSSGLLPGVLCGNSALASVPPLLANATVRAAVAMAAGQTAATGVVLAELAALTEGVLKAMFIAKVKGVVAVLLVLGLAVAGVGITANLPTGKAAEEGIRDEADSQKEAKDQNHALHADRQHDRESSDRASRASPLTPSYVVEPPDMLLIEVAGLPKSQVIDGEYLVRPDGTIALGAYGSVFVAGRSLSQLRALITDHLANHAGHAKLDVLINVVGYNSKVYYVITKGEDGAQFVCRLPDTGQTVVGAILQVEGLALMKGLARKAVRGRVWLARPSGEVLDVDWRAITQEGKSDTNYPVRSGDRVFVEGAKH